MYKYKKYKKEMSDSFHVICYNLSKYDKLITPN